MPQYVTKDHLTAATDKIINDLSDIMNSIAQQTHNEIQELKQNDNQSQDRLNVLINTIDGFIKRLDEVEAEQTARDAKFERLVEWSKKVSEKTGIPLPQL